MAKTLEDKYISLFRYLGFEALPQTWPDMRSSRLFTEQIHSNLYSILMDLSWNLQKQRFLPHCVFLPKVFTMRQFLFLCIFLYLYPPLPICCFHYIAIKSATLEPFHYLIARVMRKLPILMKKNHADFNVIDKMRECTNWSEILIWIKGILGDRLQLDLDLVHLFYVVNILNYGQ